MAHSNQESAAVSLAEIAGPRQVTATDALDAELLTITAHMGLPDAVVVAVHGEVDSSTSPLLRERLLEHLRSTSHHMVVDLVEVDFLGAAGLTVLVTTREATSAAGVKLCVVACTRPVRRPLAITGMDAVLDVHADVAGALRCRGCGGADPSPRR